MTETRFAHVERWFSTANILSERTKRFVTHCDNRLRIAVYAHQKFRSMDLRNLLSELGARVGILAIEVDQLIHLLKRSSRFEFQ